MTDNVLFEAFKDAVKAFSDRLNTSEQPQSTTEPAWARTVSCPEGLIDPKTGRMNTTLPFMPTDQGQLHLLLPSGIGDAAWVFAKTLNLEGKKDVTYWFENDEYKRVGPYCDLLGLKYQFAHTDAGRCLEFPGDLSEEDIAEGGIFYCHANLHVESGKRLEEWMPFLPYVNPAPQQFGMWKPDTERPYLIAHMGHFQYGGGNWPARLWARTVREIQKQIPVMPIGAWWDEAYMEKVALHVDFGRQPCMNRDLATALQFILRSSGMIAVDSGLAILAKYLGVPVLQAYPAWLVDPEPTKRNPTGTHMPDAWEDPATLHPKSEWCLLDEVLDRECERAALPWLDRLLK